MYPRAAIHSAMGMSSRASTSRSSEHSATGMVNARRPCPSRRDYHGRVVLRLPQPALFLAALLCLGQPAREARKDFHQVAYRVWVGAPGRPEELMDSKFTSDQAMAQVAVSPVAKTIEWAVNS